jgi:DNA-binding CsgD family transcriptional regulator
MTHRNIDPEPGVLARAARADVARSRPVVLAGAGAAFALIAALVGADVLGDIRSGGGSTHAVLELALMGIALAAAAFFGWAFLGLRRRARLLVRDLDVAQAEADRWRRETEEVLRGLSAAVDRQFERWKLSSAEREVALLLLKGLAHKEIAELRHTSERTVRQQALALYRKAGLSGRAELSAFFLEDLLLPSPRSRAREG